MKRFGRIIRLVIGNLMMLVAIGVFIYPTVSSLYNFHLAQKAVNVYTESAIYDTEKLEKEIQKAYEYNKRLFKDYTLITLINNEPDSEYESLLNLSTQGIMGYIEIPKVSTRLPIYHYSKEEELQQGIGHIRGSSLPIGLPDDAGEYDGANCVLTGHRGLPNNMLFTRLDEVTNGDRVYITVADRTICYEVTETRVVLPEEIDDIKILPGQDRLTLVTCTPYGVNSHRLIIVADRVEYSEDVKDEEQQKIATTSAIPLTRLYIAGAFLIVIIILEGILIWKKRL